MFSGVGGGVGGGFLGVKKPKKRSFQVVEEVFLGGQRTPKGGVGGGESKPREAQRWWFRWWI